MHATRTTRWMIRAVCCTALLSIASTALAQQDSPAPVVRGRRASPPQPQQQQGTDYLAGSWTYNYLGREHGLTNGPRTGTATFTAAGANQLTLKNEGKTDAGAAYTETGTYSWDPATKKLQITEALKGNAKLNGVGDWSSPLGIQFVGDPIMLNGQTIKIRRTYNVLSAVSFEIIEEVATGDGAYQRLGKATFARK